MGILKRQSNLPSYVASISVLLGLIAVLSYASIHPAQTGHKTIPQYAVMFPPGTSQMDILNTIAAAQGLPVRRSTLDFIMVAASTDKDFQKNIQNLGAIFVFSPIIRGSCVTKSQKRFNRS